jgi:hypothetical protein
MDREDTLDLVAAFVIGAVLGIGATLLLRGDPPTRTDRVPSQLKRVSRSGRGPADARHGAGRGVRAVRAAGGAALRSGRDALDTLRGDVADLVSAARDEVARSARDTVREARAALERARR